MKSKIAQMYSKVPYKILLLWVFVLIAFYNWFLEDPEVSNYDISIPTNQMVNAVVFIAMSAMSADPMVSMNSYII